MLIDFGEKGREEERGRETSLRERSIDWLPLSPQPGTECTTQACALTRNITCGPLAYGTMPGHRSHTGQANKLHLFKKSGKVGVEMDCM